MDLRAMGNIAVDEFVCSGYQQMHNKHSTYSLHAVLGRISQQSAFLDTHDSYVQWYGFTKACLDCDDWNLTSFWCIPRRMAGYTWKHIRASSILTGKPASACVARTAWLLHIVSSCEQGFSHFCHRLSCAQTNAGSGTNRIGSTCLASCLKCNLCLTTQQNFFINYLISTWQIKI